MTSHQDFAAVPCVEGDFGSGVKSDLLVLNQFRAKYFRCSFLKLPKDTKKRNTVENIFHWLFFTKIQGL